MSVFINVICIYLLHIDIFLDYGGITKNKPSIVSKKRRTPEPSPFEVIAQHQEYFYLGARPEIGPRINDICEFSFTG
jgi:hypothetical protein